MGGGKPGCPSTPQAERGAPGVKAGPGTGQMSRAGGPRREPGPTEEWADQAVSSGLRPSTRKMVGGVGGGPFPPRPFPPRPCSSSPNSGRGASSHHLLGCIVRVYHEISDAVCVIHFAMVPIEHMFPLSVCIEMYANTGRRKMAIATEEARPALGSLCRGAELWLLQWATAARQPSPARAGDPGVFFFSFSHLQSKFVYCNFFFFFVNYLP